MPLAAGRLAMPLAAGRLAMPLAAGRFVMPLAAGRFVTPAGRLVALPGADARVVLLPLPTTRLLPGLAARMRA
jgi:hypothetical protein